MNPSIRRPDILKMAGAAIFLIAGFLTWYSLEIPQIGSDDVNAFEWFPTGTLPWLLFIAVGIITALVVFGVLKSDTFPVDRVLLGLAVLAFVLFILRLALTPGVEGVSDEQLDEIGAEVTRGIGLWIGLVGALLVLAGAVMAFLDSNKVGTTTSDSYGGGYGSSSSTPPPPPPSY